LHKGDGFKLIKQTKGMLDSIVMCRNELAITYKKGQEPQLIPRDLENKLREEGQVGENEHQLMKELKSLEVVSMPAMTERQNICENNCYSKQLCALSSVTVDGQPRGPQ
jgi:hypothetical protein